MKKLLFVTLLSALFFSCSNNDDTDNNDINNGPQLVQTKQTVSNQVIITNYDNGRPVEISSTYNGGTGKTTFEYNSQGLLLKEKFYADGIIQTSYDYEYNNEQRLIKITKINENGTVSEYPCTYNSDNTISIQTHNGTSRLYVNIDGKIHKVTYSVNAGAFNFYRVAADIVQFEGENPLVYTMNGNNSYTGNGLPERTYTLQYDNEHDKSLLNPDITDPVKRMNDIIRVAFKSEQFSWSQVESTKYLTQERMTEEGSASETISNFTYTFNEQGLPVIMEEYNYSYSDTPMAVTEYIYE